MNALDYPGQPRDDHGRFAEGKLEGSEYEKPTGIIKTSSGKLTLDKAERERYDNLLLGSKTTDGHTVNVIRGHAYQRAAERALSPGEIRDCIKQASVTFPGNVSGRIAYQLGTIRVIFGTETGEIVTVIRLGGKTP